MAGSMMSKREASDPLTRVVLVIVDGLALGVLTQFGSSGQFESVSSGRRARAVPGSDRLLARADERRNEAQLYAPWA